MNRTLFVSGVDTGVGKTTLTSILLFHLRSEGRHVRAIKPFCSGSLADSEILGRLQDGELRAQEITPFFFSPPLAPLVAARKLGQAITLEQTLKKIQPLRSPNHLLLVEGAGGLLSPLGEGFNALHLVQALRARLVLVAPNRLGVINQALMGVRVAPLSLRKKMAVVLMDQKNPDPSAPDNAKVLREFLTQPVINMPYLGSQLSDYESLKKIARKIKKGLDPLLKADTLMTLFR